MVLYSAAFVVYVTYRRSREHLVRQVLTCRNAMHFKRALRSLTTSHRYCYANQLAVRSSSRFDTSSFALHEKCLKSYKMCSIVRDPLLKP